MATFSLPLTPGVSVGGWEVIRELREGGQGNVYLVRNPQRVQEIASQRKELLAAFRGLGSVGQTVEKQQEMLDDFLTSTSDLTKPEIPESLGALKIFKFEGQRGQAAKERLVREVEVLRACSDPAIVCLLDAQPDEGWMVTAYQQGGTLEDDRQRYKGKALDAIRALLPIARAVTSLHEQGVIHRDIKPNNIFLSGDRLVLGDFGIVFYADDKDRLTRTFERVGGQDWMAPWANVKKRLDDVNQSFDVFPLGKVLWAMISGEQMLPYWWFDHDEYNLQRLFQRDSAMALVNRVLSKCVVEHEGSCFGSKQFLLLLEQAREILERGGEILTVGQTRPCRVCGVGFYEQLWSDAGFRGVTYRVNFDEMKENEVRDGVKPLSVHTYKCRNCGHIQLFNFPSQDPPQGWTLPNRN